MDDLIDRQAAIDELGYCQTYLFDSRDKDKKISLEDAEYVIEQLPSAQPNIKQSAKLLSDFIESCSGGDSYLITPDGEELRTDWGYATEGIQLIYDWAERRSDELGDS